MEKFVILMLRQVSKDRIDTNKIVDGCGCSVRCTDWTKDGKRLAAGYDDRRVRIWDVSERRCLAVLDGHRESIKSIAWSPDNRLLASGDNAAGLRIWDLNSLEKDGGKLLEEKSLGCIHKGGHRPISAVYDYGKQVTEKGLVIMDTPGNDPSSVAGMVAGGAQVIVFSTGRGTPTGNPISPVIKITGNKITYENMIDNIDFDASGVIYGTETLDGLGEKLLEEVVEVANGKQTKAESLGYTEMAIARLCNYV